VRRWGDFPVWPFASRKLVRGSVGDEFAVPLEDTESAAAPEVIVHRGSEPAEAPV